MGSLNSRLLTVALLHAISTPSLLPMPKDIGPPPPKPLTFTQRRKQRKQHR